MRKGFTAVKINSDPDVFKDECEEGGAICQSKNPALVSTLTDTVEAPSPSPTSSTASPNASPLSLSSKRSEDFSFIFTALIYHQPVSLLLDYGLRL